MAITASGASQMSSRGLPEKPLSSRVFISAGNSGSIAASRAMPMMPTTKAFQYGLT